MKRGDIDLDPVNREVLGQPRVAKSLHPDADFGRFTEIVSPNTSTNISHRSLVSSVSRGLIGSGLRGVEINPIWDGAGWVAVDWLAR